MARVFFLALLLYCLPTYAQQIPPPANDVIRSTITDETGITIETRVLIEKSGEQAKITFQQETENGFIFKNVSWAGDVMLYLTDGTVITLEDTKMKGHSMESGGYIAGYYVPNRYERFASYFLSAEECELMQKSPVKRVEYRTDDAYNKSIHHLNLQDYDWLLKTQLNALGL